MIHVRPPGHQFSPFSAESSRLDNLYAAPLTESSRLDKPAQLGFAASRDIHTFHVAENSSAAELQTDCRHAR